jgi:hypothetical protein
MLVFKTLSGGVNSGLDIITPTFFNILITIITVHLKIRSIRKSIKMLQDKDYNIQDCEVSNFGLLFVCSAWLILLYF